MQLIGINRFETINTNNRLCYVFLYILFGLFVGREFDARFKCALCVHFTRQWRCNLNTLLPIVCIQVVSPEFEWKLHTYIWYIYKDPDWFRSPLHVTHSQTHTPNNSEYTRSSRSNTQVHWLYTFTVPEYHPNGSGKLHLWSPIVSFAACMWECLFACVWILLLKKQRMYLKEQHWSQCKSDLTCSDRYFIVVFRCWVVYVFWWSLA